LLYVLTILFYLIKSTEEELPAYEELLEENRQLKQKLEERDFEVRNLSKENKINVC